MKKLVKGSRLDERPGDQPESTWRLARNMTNYKAFGALSPEDGCDNITPTSIPTTNYKNFPTKPVIGIIPINKGSVFFFSPSITGNDSEIGIVDPLNRYTPILRDIAGRVVLDFSLNSPIQGTYEYKFNDNLIIAWRDNRNNPFILNKDCLPFEIDSSFNVTSGDFNKAKALIKLFPDVATPIISDIYLSDNGGNLKTGTYFPIVSYELSDKSVTSWLRVYNPIPVVQDASTIAFKDYDGNFSDIPTSKRMHLQFTSVDTNYLNLRFGIITLKAGIYTAYYIDSYRISGSTLEFDYTGSEGTITPITLDEVLIPNAVYTKAGTITNLLGSLYLGDVEKQQQFAYQKYANTIEVNWVRGDDITLNTNQSSSYKDEKIIFFDKSFRSDEVVALYIAFKLKNGGTYTDAYHIPGRPPLAGDTSVVSGTGFPDIDALDSNVKKFQVRETALVDGTMGYWENNTEFYPNISDFDSTSLGGIDLRGLPVRHHKLPEIQTIIKSGNPYFHKFNKIGGDLIIKDPFTLDPSPFSGTSSYEYTVLSNTTSLTFTDPGGVVPFNEVSNTVANRAIRMSGDIVFSITGIQPSGAGSIITIQPYIEGSDLQQYLLDTYTITYAMTSGTGNYSGSIPYTKQWLLFTIGDKLGIGLDAAINNALVTLNFTGTTLTIEEGTYTSTTKPLGLKISNVVIPADISDQIDSWEIFYAKRTNSNIRVIGQDIIKEGRLHTFDLVYNQSNLRADFIKPQVLFEKDSLIITTPPLQDYVTSPIIYEALIGTIVPGLTKINTFYYLGQDVLSPIDNTGKSTSIYIEPNITSIYGYNYDNILFDLHIYRKDVYKAFDSQILISTGYAAKVTSSGIQSTQDIYGGDTFISAFGFIEDTVAKTQYLIPQESAANIGLRMDDEIQVPPKYYYPKHISSDPTPPSISFYGYNNDFTALNDLNKVFPKTLSFNECIDDIYIFPYLIPFSITDANESIKLNWRIFKVNSYYDRLDKSKGRIWNLLGSNRTLYIQQEYALSIASVKDDLQINGESIGLGTSDVFARPPVEVAPTSEGYVGSQCQFATILCPLGYVTVDRQQGKIFIYNGQVTEISAEGYYGYFLEKVQTTNTEIDNPFIGNGYTCTYDYDFNRLLITKKDSESQFTISYCGDTKSWISLHDYHPNYMFTTRYGTFLGDNSSYKLYRHNSETLKGIFFNNIMYRSYVDVVFNLSQEITKNLMNVNWITNTIALDSVVKDKETFTSLVIYNDNQCSGEINLQADDGLWYGKDARNTEQTWNFNKFRDLIKDSNQRFLDENGELISSNINNNKPWFDKSKFISKFVIVRFIYNNVNQRDLYIIGVDTNMRESKR